MNPEYITRQLIMIGKKMRTAQKNFFATKSYEAEKRTNYYNESKHLERQFDHLLAQAEQILNQKSAS